MMFDNRKDKIQLIKDGLNIKSLDDIFSTLEMLPKDMYTI